MYIEMGGIYKINNKSIFGRKVYVDISNGVSEIEKIRKRFNNIDVYATILQYDKEDQNKSNLYGPLYLDLDMDFNNDNEYQKIKQDLYRIVTYLNLQYGIPTKYIKFFFTGKKGFHLIISPIVFQIKPNNDLNILYKEIAKELNDNTIYKIVDTKIYDKKRLLRLVNSINGKTGLYKVPITYENICAFSYEEIREYAKEIKKLSYEKPIPIDKAINKINSIFENMKQLNIRKAASIIIPKNVDISKIDFPSCIKSIFNNGVTEGNRNNTTQILASALFQKGISLETGLNIIHKWNLEKNSPSLSDSEIEITVNSAYQQIIEGKRYGCSSIKDMELCVGNECKIFK